MTCNCRVLKLYTTPRLQKSRKGTKYHELQDPIGSESSRYAVLSVTNPNYSDAETLTDGVFDGFDKNVQTINGLEDDKCIVKMVYNEETISSKDIPLHARNDERLVGKRFNGVYDRMIVDAVPVKDVLGGPIPAPL